MQARTVASADGPITDFVVTCATVVGAGILLGGFAAGLVGLLHSWERDDFDFQVRRFGYLGGILGLIGLLFDRS